MMTDHVDVEDFFFAWIVAVLGFFYAVCYHENRIDKGKWTSTFTKPFPDRWDNALMMTMVAALQFSIFY